MPDRGPRRSALTHAPYALIWMFVCIHRPSYASDESKRDITSAIWGSGLDDNSPWARVGAGWRRFARTIHPNMPAILAAPNRAQLLSTSALLTVSASCDDKANAVRVPPQDLMLGGLGAAHIVVGCVMGVGGIQHR